MLSGFRRRDAEFRIDSSRDVVSSGEELSVTVVLIPKESFRIRRGQVELLCTENYVQLISSQYGTQYHKAEHVRHRQRQVFMEDVRVRAGSHYGTTVKFTVPADEMPTIKSISVRSIETGFVWSVKASLDVAGGRDMESSEEVWVKGVGAVDGSMATVSDQSTEIEARHRQCVLNLNIASHNVRSRERVSGSLCAKMLQDVVASDVTVELLRVEKFGSFEETMSVDRVVLEENVVLRAGEVREWDFLPLSVGEVEVPSLKTDKSSVRWLVRGKMTRDMGRDLRIEQEISVGF